MIDCLYSFLWLQGRGKLIFGNYYNYVKQLHCICSDLCPNSKYTGCIYSVLCRTKTNRMGNLNMK